MEATSGGGGGGDTDQKKKQGKMHALHKKVIKPLFGKNHPPQEYSQSQDMAEDKDIKDVTGEEIKTNQSRKEKEEQIKGQLEGEVKKTVKTTVRAKFEGEMMRWKEANLKRVRGSSEIIQSSVAKDILTKEQEITRLQIENKQMKEDTESYKRLKSKYLKLHEEKMELLEKLEERDAQVKMLSQVTVEYPTVKRSLSAGELRSPDDSKTEIYQLRKVIEDKEKKINMKLQSFEKVASGNTDLGQQVVKLKEQLKATQAKIEQLRNDSELAHVCESLRSEVVTLRKQLKDAEKDHETEKDVWEKELEAEMQNNSQLKAEVDKLEAALRSLQSRHSSVDVEFIAMNDSAMDQSREDAEFITGLHQDEVEELKRKLGRRNSSIKNLHAHRKSLEGQLLAVKEDRDRLAQQNVELFVMMSNLKGKLNANTEEYAQQSEKQLFELKGLKSEKEALVEQMQCLNDEVVAWKFEATINKEDFEHERRDRENMASHMSDEFGRWSVKEHEYQGIIGGLENELKRVKHEVHEVEEQLYTLNVQLEQREALLEKFKENQITQQKELDEIRDNLREERDIIKTELNHMTEKYMSLKEGKKNDSESLQEKLDLLQVQNSSLEECVNNLKEEAQKLNETIEKYKKEKDALLLHHSALKVQRQIDHAQWMENEEDTSRMTEEILSKTQQVKQYKEQADSLKDQLQKVKQELERQQAYFQEMLLRKDEEHKAKIALQTAQFNCEKMDMERVLMPKRRELEQLRKQRMSESQFAETFRIVEEEKRQVIEELNELKRKHRNLQEDYLLARDVLIKNSIPLPQSTYQNDGQIKMETMPQTSTSASHDIQPYSAVSRSQVTLRSRISQGSWGTVNRGIYCGQEVAIKQPHAEIIHEKTIERLRREVSCMSQMHHPNIVTFFGAVFDEHPIPMIITELMDMNLRDGYKQENFTRKQIIDIFKDVAYALHYLHEFREPTIHRDLSSPNVLLRSLSQGKFIAKVTDFGSANLVKYAKTAGEGAIVYSAPEMFPNRTVPRQKHTVKVDTFSYGILLCEVILQKMPDPDHHHEMLHEAEMKWKDMHTMILMCTKTAAVERPTMSEIIRNLLEIERNSSKQACWYEDFGDILFH